VRRGENGEQRGEERGRGVLINSRRARSRVHLMEAIGGFGRRAGDDIVVLVQWCGREARARAVPTARRTDSVVVQCFRDTAGRFRWESALGEDGMLLGLRCRAG
jgi:hypothetical protein